MQLFGVAGTWVAAFGTIGAVIVALFIAGRVEKVKLRINLFVGKVQNSNQEYFVVTVTNLGVLPVTIKMINWSFRVGTKTRIIFFKFDKTTIEHGEYLDYREGPFESKRWFANLATLIGKDATNSLRLQVHSSVGKVKNFKPDGSFLKNLEQSHTNSMSF